MKARIYRLVYALPFALLAVKLAVKALAASVRNDVGVTELIDTDGSDFG